MNSRVRWVVAMIIVLVLTGCSSRLKLTIIPAENVPSVMRGFASARGDTMVTWRAVYPHEDFLVGIYTFLSSKQTPQGQPSGIQWLVYANNGQGDPILDWNDTATGDAFGAELRTERYHEVDGLTRYDLAAYGWAYHKSAAKVVATTSMGRSVTAQVVNGHWFLIMLDAPAPEVLVAVDVQDSQGKVIFSHRQP